MRRHLFLFFTLVVAACIDPVQSKNEADQEPNEEPENELHNAGKWCTACHTANGSGPEFSVAGTLYEENLRTPAIGARIFVTDGKGKVHDLGRTNSVGNFYMDKKDFDPVYPLQVEVISAEGISKKMGTLIGRDGGCGRCHQGNGDRSHMPRVYVLTKPPAVVDAGAAKDGAK